jgi:NodT family efflux transporter outer membrane factor (OMF) lipoprotein
MVKPPLQYAFVLIPATLLAACTVGPDFQRPVSRTPSVYTDEDLHNLSASDQSLVSGQNPVAGWWRLFGSAELDTTVELALSGNRDLASAEATLAQAREAVSASAGSLVPQLNLDASTGRQKYGAQFRGPQYFPPFTYFALGPSVSYLLDYTGGERRAVEQQQSLADYQAFQVQAAYLNLTGDVVGQALVMASTGAQIEAVESLLAQDRQNLSLVQSAFGAGSVSRLDVLSAQSQLAEDQTLLPPLRQQLSVARHALSILTGQAPADWAPPDFHLSALRLPRSLPLTVPSELVHRRPDILSAESHLHAATAAVGVATSALYPQIMLTASAGPQALQISHLFDKSSAAWSLAAGVSAPLLDGGSRRAQRRAALDAMQAALASYQQTVLRSFGQVADVLTALDHDAEQLAAQKNALDSAEASLNLSRLSYGFGNTGVLQVLDAERLYQQARLGYLRAQAQRYQDTVQLFLALGGSDPGEPSAGSPLASGHVIRAIPTTSNGAARGPGR